MRYRPEIDGLRAVAVLPVILYHAGFGLFGGGYVGVDVFFVISGFLITSIIMADLEKGRFSILEFYERRARRILPALFVMMAVSSLFAWRWLLPADLKGFAQSVVAVSAFASNILFWKTSDYFDTAAELKPLLHTWSLAVEEQFYVIFPLLLMLAWRFGKRRIVALLGVLALASLAVAQWGASAAPTANFFLLPSRGWELLIGAFAAFHFSNPDRRTPAQPLREAGGWTGLVLIACAVFLYGSQTPYPSVYTLVPTVGALLVILFAGADTGAGRLLGSRWFAGVGMISYSAYLWHQPLLAFARYRMPGHPDQLMLGALAAGSLVLAYFSWKYVETPFRQKNVVSRATIFGCSAIACAAFAAAGFAGHVNKGYPSRFPAIEDLLAIRTVDSSPCHTLSRRTADQIRRGDMCKVGAAVTPHFAVIGDSHAGALFESLGRRQGDRPFSFYAVSGGFCAPLLEFRFVGNTIADCDETTSAAFRQVMASPAIDTVVLFAEWANYTKGYRDDGNDRTRSPGLVADSLGAAQTPEQNRMVFERSLQRTVDALERAGKQVVIIEPVPEFPFRVFDSVAKQIVYTGGARDYPRVSIADYRARNHEVLEAFARLHGVRFVDSASLFCSKDNCSSADGRGRILFSDTNHVNEYGADLIAGELMKYIAQPHDAGSAPARSAIASR
ncbi:acyltransferase [Massilia solisilvae]|uniref:Acyltransferase n=1 Tax=Massilia solisilvae TaxID=1811225 RepID=A0ABT2BEQ9_9BURK|nr:acyltransferase family protein [Massilia solisilvae]MCS0607001.1 acyltransferase [Massilia solisilvae]